MSDKARRALVLLTVVLMLGALDAPAMGTVPTDGAGEARGAGPPSGEPVWTDTLDDASHVYVNSTMPVNVEVSGGDAHLRAGATYGWLASEAIACPPGYRYDLVYLEVEAPGYSYVEVSVLDPKADPPGRDFANGTLEGLKRVRATDVSLNAVDAGRHPEIRVQVDLHADGAHRPRLLAWSVLFVDVGEWRDDFLGTGKMTSHRHLNLTDDGLEINHTSNVAGGGVGDYEPYPTLAWGLNDRGLRLMYPNWNHTGYEDITSMDVGWTLSTGFGDFDKDGYLDLVSGNHIQDSKILWGDLSGKYSASRSTDLRVDTVDQVAVGDFNGDGWEDIAAGCFGIGPYSSRLFLNKGDGTFKDKADVIFQNLAVYYVYAGDLNNDGYDDVVFSLEGGTRCYFGGPDGPDTTVDIRIDRPDGEGAIIGDLDQDGYIDIVCLGKMDVDTAIYLGGEGGPDTTPDILIPTPGSSAWPWHGSIGDINGDGHNDMVIGFAIGSSSSKLVIYKGSASGWNGSDTHEIDIGTQPASSVADLNRDGYDDIMLNNRLSTGNVVDIYLGGPTWPTAHHIRKTGSGYIVAPITSAIPRPSGDVPGYSASFTTESIALPAGMRWDIVDVEATVPKNTSVSVVVLNETGAPLSGIMDELDMDLSGLNPELHRAIRLRVQLRSDLNDTTPTLRNLLVKWIDQMAWREEFYGRAKVDRLFDLAVEDGYLRAATRGGTAPQLVIPSYRGDRVFDPMSLAHRDGGGLDYESLPPLPFPTTGPMAASVVDVDGDGHLDVAFAAYTSGGPYDFDAQSMVFLGSPVGWRDVPHWAFNTTGARDVLLEDLDGDGHGDIVLAQEQDGFTYAVDSLLFWGSPAGWGDEPDVRFATTGASGVVAEDLDGDGRLDLAFACYKAPSGPSESMVFLQDGNGYCGTAPDVRLTTQGARAVAAGDLNGDDLPDLVFARTRFGGAVPEYSSIYLALEGGGFETTPANLATKDAQDVKVADLDGDGDLDIVFANHREGPDGYSVGSPVFINDGEGGFTTGPSLMLATTGAMAVEVADLDGTGWLDLVFACHYNGTSYEQDSVAYLGGASGYGSTPDIRIPTSGASDVVAAHLFDPGDGGYMSQTIAPLDPEGTGGFHTLSYTATLGGAVSGALHVHDAVTWERLASTPIVEGTNEWDLRGVVYLKEHDRVRIVASVEGMDASGTFQLDDLHLNWTRRVKAPPRVVDLALSAASAYRTGPVTLWVNVTDEYDPPGDLLLTIKHRLEGSPDWLQDLLGPLECIGGVWTCQLDLGADVQLGVYSFRVTAVDRDDMASDLLEPPVTLEVLNNVPTAPEVALGPEAPLTGDTLSVTITRSARDVESPGLQYRFRWFQNGGLIPDLATDRVPSDRTARGDNWTVEVRAFDGDDEGPAARAWVVIGNSPTKARGELEELSFEEDGEARTIDISGAFEDPDRDALSYGVEGAPANVTVEVDAATGQATLVPAADWSGVEEVTFWASDGEHTARQTLRVNVTPVNDPPTFTEVNGRPVATGIMVLKAVHGRTLVITYAYNDVEGDMVMPEVDSDEVILDAVLREIRFTPSDDMVGTVTFKLTIWDEESPGEKRTLEFQIEVENVNDPPGVPVITAPPAGSRFKVNETFGLAGTCDDPDLRFGQVLAFTWTSNISGLLGTGPGLDVSLAVAGTHLITLTVSDGEFEGNATIVVVIEPIESVAPPPAPPTRRDDGPDLLWVPVVLVLAILGVGLTAASASTEAGRYRWGLLLAPLLIKKDEVLDNKTRYALHGIISEKPGIHYTALKEEFDLANGAAAYHLDVLEREEFIRSVRDGRLKRFYSTDTKVPENPRMTPEEVREAIVQLVRERPGISQKRIINELGVDRDSVGYFLRELVKEGTLRDSKDGRFTVYRVK